MRKHAEFGRPATLPPGLLPALRTRPISTPAPVPAAADDDPEEAGGPCAPSPLVMLLGALWLIGFGGVVMWVLQGDRSNLLPMGVGYRAAFTGAGLLWAGFMTALVPGDGVKRVATGLTGGLLLLWLAYQLVLLTLGALAAEEWPVASYLGLTVVYAVSVAAIGGRLLRGRWR